MDFYEPGAEASGSIVVNSIVVFGYVLVSFSIKQHADTGCCSACLILFQNIVPISLVISIELVKTVQALFIFNDLDMYYEPVSLLL